MLWMREDRTHWPSPWKQPMLTSSHCELLNIVNVYEIDYLTQLIVDQCLRLRMARMNEEMRDSEGVFGAVGELTSWF